MNMNESRVKRVEIELPRDATGVWLNNWEPPEEALEFITGNGPVHLDGPPYEIDKEFTWWINEDVKATLVLEMRDAEDNSSM